jgi:D-alanyl-D-alanine carboxypeptidase
MPGDADFSRLARIAALAGVLALLLLAYDARPQSPPADAVTVRSRAAIEAPVLVDTEAPAAAMLPEPDSAPAPAAPVDQAVASLPTASPPPAASLPTAEATPAAVELALAIAAPPLDPAPWTPIPERSASAPPAPASGALAAIVLDEASGAVLYEHDAHRELAPASLTKIATAIVALRHGGLDEEAVSDVDGFAMRGSTTMGLYSGDRLTRRDLLYGLMLPSGNDAALVLGRSVAGTDAAFVRKMNELVRELGLKHTSFENPHGLGRANYTSAYDMAMLSRHAMQYPEFREVVGTISWNVTGTRRYAVHNINSFLFSYDGADGVKTGFTNSAGRTLVASATRGGYRLFAVLLNDQNRYTDAAALLDWAFANHTWSSTP